MLNVTKKILNNARGFSIIQAIIAAGVIGAASVGVMQMSQNQIEDLLYLETKQEEAALVKQIETLMLQESACTQSFVGSAFPSPQNDLVSASGATVFNTVASDPDFYYGGGSIQIESLDLINDSAAVSAAPNPVVASSDGVAWLEVTFKRVKRKKGPETVTRRIKLSATGDGAGNLQSCHADVSDYLDEAKEEICISLGGLLNASGNCDMSCTSTGPSDAVSAECLAARTSFEPDGTTAGGYDARWLQKSGASPVTGDLTIVNAGALGDSIQAQNINSSLFCVGSNCRNFVPESCAVGEIVRGVDTAGNPICTSISCPTANQYFAGLDASGNAICNTFPTETCGTDQYAADVDPDGTLNCQPVPTDASVATCPNGQYIASIDAAGNRTCAIDRRVEMASDHTGGCIAGQAISSISNAEIADCGVIEDTSAQGITCASNEYLRGFDANGNRVCEAFGGPPPTYACTGSVAANASACSNAGTALTANRAYAHNGSCSGSGDTCQYSCNSGYTWDGSSCVADFAGIWCETTTTSYSPSINPEFSGGDDTDCGETPMYVRNNGACAMENDLCTVNKKYDSIAHNCVSTCGAAPSFFCSDEPPTNATACSDAGAALTADRAYTHNASCAGDGDTCEYSCDSGFTWNSGTGECEADAAPYCEDNWRGPNPPGVPSETICVGSEPNCCDMSGAPDCPAGVELQWNQTDENGDIQICKYNVFSGGNNGDPSFNIEDFGSENCSISSPPYPAVWPKTQGTATLSCQSGAWVLSNEICTCNGGGGAPGP